MKMPFARFVSIALFLMHAGLYAQVRTELRFPDIPGYQTLKCDFHLHTCFSDGTPWPTERVKEAWIGGLDVIAITDHIEHRPNAGYITDDLNAPWEIARKEAERLNIILIRGAEITRNMPPGHFNAIFLNDVNALVQDKFMDAVAAAVAQDAFIFWNHPGWRQGAPDTPFWYPVHKELLQKGWMHGIEVVNWEWYYPEAHQSAIDFGLTMLGNSDSHEPLAESSALNPEWHRPLTLVFVRKHSAEDVREALKSGRTAVWYKQKLFASGEFAKPLVENALEIINPVIVIRENKRGTAQIRNTSDLQLILKPEVPLVGLKFPDSIVIPPNATVAVEVSARMELRKQGLLGYNTNWIVQNVFIAPGKNLELQFPLSILDLDGLCVIKRGDSFFLHTGNPQGVGIRYALDMKTPVNAFRNIDQPLPVGMHRLVFQYVLDGEPLEHLLEREIIVHKGAGAQQKLINLPEKKYAGNTPNTLCDGILGTENFRSGHWLGFYKDVNTSLLFDEKIKTDSVGMRFLKDEDSWIFLPDEIAVEVSEDGKTFSGISLKGITTEGKIHTWMFGSKGMSIKEIKVFAVNPGLCPPGHAGEGEPGWIFSDEVIIY